VVAVTGTGHALVDREFARKGTDRNVVLRVPSFLGIARIVATTEPLASVARDPLGEPFLFRQPSDTACWRFSRTSESSE